MSPALSPLKNMSLISNEAIHSALVKELCSGRALMETMQSQREMECAREAEYYRKNGSKNWKFLAAIPQHEYFILRQKYGDEAFHDREFVQDFQRTQPHLAGAKA